MKMFDLIEKFEIFLLRRKYGDELDDPTSWVGVGDAPFTRRFCKKVAEEFGVEFDGVSFIGSLDRLCEVIGRLAGPVRLGDGDSESIPLGVRYDDGWWYGGFHPSGFINRLIFRENIYSWRVFSRKLTLREAIAGLFRAL